MVQAANKKHKWIRANKWVGSINKEMLPYTEADFQVTVGPDGPMAKVVIKRVISEVDTLRRLVSSNSTHSIELSSMQKHEAKDQPAVSLALHNAKVISYWLEDTKVDTGYAIERDGNKDTFYFHVPQDSPRDTPGIDAKSSGLTLECIEFESAEFKLD